MKKFLFLFYILITFSLIQVSCKKAEPKIIHFSEHFIYINGFEDDISWKNATWEPIPYNWLGDKTDSSDFTGKYKLLWDEKYLYVLAKIVDDNLLDTHFDDFDSYKDDDGLVIYIDEDASGGDHQYNHQAFAYHLNFNSKTVDLGTDSLPHYYEHCFTSIRQDNDTLMYEVVIRLFDKTYQNDTLSKQVNLFDGKKIGFAIAYNDNDVSDNRENLFGSVDIEGDDKEIAEVNSDVFEKYILKK